MCMCFIERGLHGVLSYIGFGIEFSFDLIPAILLKSTNNVFVRYNFFVVSIVSSNVYFSNTKILIEFRCPLTNH